MRIFCWRQHGDGPVGPPPVCTLDFAPPPCPALHAHPSSSLPWPTIRPKTKSLPLQMVSVEVGRTAVAHGPPKSYCLNPRALNRSPITPSGMEVLAWQGLGSTGFFRDPTDCSLLIFNWVPQRPPWPSTLVSGKKAGHGGCVWGGFRGQGWGWCSSLLFAFLCLELGHRATSNCKGAGKRGLAGSLVLTALALRVKGRAEAYRGGGQRGRPAPVSLRWVE